MCWLLVKVDKILRKSYNKGFFTGEVESLKFSNPLLFSNPE